MCATLLPLLLHATTCCHQTQPPHPLPIQPFPVLFGVLIVLAVACGLLYWKLAWRRTAAWCTALLWLDVALLMLLGAGELWSGALPWGHV